jgi:outer membrane protein assembly factor BamB
VPQEKSFGKITFRSGFGEDDQFLLLDGIWGGPFGKPIQDCNAILQFTQNSCTFLVDLDPETQNRRCSYVNHNVLSVTCDGQAPQPPHLATLEGLADLPSWGYTHTRLDPYMNGAWDRYIFWRKGRYFVVRDVFRASRPGVYALESQWRTLGRTVIDGSDFRSTVGGPGFAEAREDTFVVKTAEQWPVRYSLVDIAADTVSRQYAHYAPPVINRLRPTAVRSLAAGEEIGITTLLYATSETQPRQYAIRELEASAVVIAGDEPAWIATPGAEGNFARVPLVVQATALWAMATGVAAQGLTRLEFDGQPWFVSSKPLQAEFNLAEGAGTLVLREPATVQAASLGEVKLEAGEHHLTGLKPVSEGDLARLRQALEQDVQAVHPKPATDEALRPALTAPALPLAPELLPGVTVNDLKVCSQGDAALLLVGCEDGRALLLDRQGQVKWEFQTGGPVHVVETADLAPGQPAALVGSDDERLYALDLASGQKLWEHQAQVFPEARGYPWWTLDGKAKVRSILAADFYGDGKTEIAIGTGGMQVEMLNADGSLRWRLPVHYGLATQLVASRTVPEGPLRLLAGMDVLASQSNVFRFHPDGQLESADAYPSGRGGWDYTGITALASTNLPDGRTVLAVGRSGAYNEVWFYDATTAQKLGLATVGDLISGLFWLPSPKVGGGAGGGGQSEQVPVAVATTHAGWVIGFRPDGVALWSVPLPEAVVRSWALGGDRVVAYCENGEFYVLNAAGRVTARGRGPWPAVIARTVVWGGS